jgi:hypothetical protein
MIDIRGGREKVAHRYAFNKNGVLCLTMAIRAKSTHNIPVFKIKGFDLCPFFGWSSVSSQLARSNIWRALSVQI